MDILSFTTIILMLFIIIGCYLIFTDQIQGRGKIIITVAVLICFIYIFMNLNLFKSYTETKSSPLDASVVQTKEKVDTTSTSFSLSTWIYITDWNSGTEKIVFSMTNPVVTSYSPKITLGPYSNELVITYYTTPSTADSANWRTVNTALSAYNTAKASWITASNAERDASGNYFTASSGGVGTTPDSAAASAQSSLATATATALTNLTNARAAYDGGAVGTDTIVTPSNRTSTSVNGGTAVYSKQSASISEINLGKTTTQNYSSTTNALKTYNSDAANANSQVSWLGDAQNFSKETIKIPNISIQKWVNIVVSFGDNTVDTYINGKLVNSHVSTGSVQRVTTVANDTTLSWGPFTGYISASRYYPRFLTPQEAWSIYSEGFSDSLLGNFLNQYNAKFTFTQNQVEKASFYIL